MKTNDSKIQLLYDLVGNMNPAEQERHRQRFQCGGKFHFDSNLKLMEFEDILKDLEALCDRRLSVN